TPGGQAAFFRAVQDVTAAAEGGRGRGVVYWEPAWTAVEGAGWDPEDPSSGNAWENQAMFDFSGAALPEVLAELGATHERWAPQGPASVMHWEDDEPAHRGPRPALRPAHHGAGDPGGGRRLAVPAALRLRRRVLLAAGHRGP